MDSFCIKLFFTKCLISGLFIGSIMYFKKPSEIHNHNPLKCFGIIFLSINSASLFIRANNSVEF